jgi:hypothetical protein
VGQCTAEGLGDWFAKSSTKASSNYGIDRDGRVGLYVEEKNRSWCSSSNANDQRAVTIECASDTSEPYAFRDVVYQKLITLCIDICRRNGKSKLLWIPDKAASLAYEPKEDEMLLTVHRWFANKSCPGDWLYNRLGALAWQVTDLLSPKEKTGVPGDGNTPHDWAVEAFKWAVENGILRGSSEDKEDYRLNDPVTREEMLTFLFRALR